MVIDDGDSPPDQEQERLLTEPQGDLVKSQDMQPLALGQGLPSRPPGLLGGDPGTSRGGEGRACPPELLAKAPGGFPVSALRGPVMSSGQGLGSSLEQSSLNPIFPEPSLPRGLCQKQVSSILHILSESTSRAFRFGGQPSLPLSH